MTDNKVVRSIVHPRTCCGEASRARVQISMIMGFPRRRSLWLKVAVLAAAVWVTVCFLLYTEDHASAVDVQGGLAPSGIAAAPQVANGFAPPALAVRRETPGNAQSKSKINQGGPEQGTSNCQIHRLPIVNLLIFFFLSGRVSNSERAARKAFIKPQQIPILE